MVTQQPLPNNECKCDHNDLSFSNNISETKSGFKEGNRELDDNDNEMKIRMKRCTFVKLFQITASIYTDNHDIDKPRKILIVNFHMDSIR